MITLQLAKTHCKVDEDDDDILIGGYIKAAVAYCEGYTGRVMSSRDKTFEFKCFGDCLDIGLRPLEAVTTILYTAPDGQEQTLDPTKFRLVGDKIYPALGEAFPAIAYPSLVMATVTLGEEDEEPLEVMTQAALLLISHWYENREAVVVGTISSNIPFAVTSLLDLHRQDLA